MKELRKYFNHYKKLYPELSSFMHFVKAVKQTAPTRRNVFKGFDELVERGDYSISNRLDLIDQLSKKWGSE